LADVPGGPLYSIVIQTFDRPEALRGCLETIERLRWRGRPPEVIVVDDGSDPPCRDVAGAFASRLRISYDHRPNRGVAVARNRGLALASGDFVGFVADDHRLPPDYLSSIDGFFRSHPDAQVISFNLSSSGRSRLRAVQALYLRLALGQSFRIGDSRSEAIASTTLPASRAAMFRRGVFDLVGPFDERLRVGEDGEMGRRLAEHGLPVYIFPRRFVDHHEDRSALDYLRQRLRYGRSFARVLGGGAARGPLQRLSWLGIPLCAQRKLREWWPVATDQRLRGRFLLFAPLLFGFLVAFYLGCWLQLRDEAKR